MSKNWVGFGVGSMLAMVITLGIVITNAGDRTMYKKEPCDLNGGSCGAINTDPPEDEPDVPGCTSLTASQECINNGRDCVHSLEKYHCCRLDDGSCMTLIGDPGEALTASGVLVRSAKYPLLPGDFIFELEGEPIHQMDEALDLYECLAVMPHARVLRTAVDPWGNRYLTTLEVEVPRGFLWHRATFTPRVGFTAR